MEKLEIEISPQNQKKQSKDNKMSLDWSTQKVKHFTDNPDDLWVKYNVGTKEEYEDVNA